MVVSEREMGILLSERNAVADHQALRQPGVQPRLLIHALPDRNTSRGPASVVIELDPSNQCINRSSLTTRRPPAPIKRLNVSVLY